ncbi:hypothetical protein CEXT_67241 [Caerostris extrusa]|uniref:Uncharacterized protein n=1 Tax=Caerostris extrusa TaxID=172846 RepID=A0AAV4USX2_CAEEX|nr:hypothetical protein CEXT_67241 [Caerostris extrusa]
MYLFFVHITASSTTNNAKKPHQTPSSQSETSFQGKEATQDMLSRGKLLGVVRIGDARLSNARAVFGKRPMEMIVTQPRYPEVGY